MPNTHTNHTHTQITITSNSASNSLQSALTYQKAIQYQNNIDTLTINYIEYHRKVQILLEDTTLIAKSIGDKAMNLISNEILKYKNECNLIDIENSLNDR